MKKEYIQPEVKEILVNYKATILAGSLSGDANTPDYDPEEAAFDDENDI